VGAAGRGAGLIGEADEPDVAGRARPAAAVHAVLRQVGALLGRVLIEEVGISRGLYQEQRIRGAVLDVADLDWVRVSRVQVIRDDPARVVGDDARGRAEGRV